MQKSVQEKIDSFFSKYKEEDYKRGDVILHPEDEIHYIYNIRSGFVKSYSVNEGGFELTINIYKPFNFFPITETLAKKDNPYYFEALSELVLNKAPVKEVLEFIKNDNEVLFDLTRRISSGLEGFMVRTQHLIRSNSLQKITSSLVLLSLRFGKKTDDGSVVIPLPQTHEDIANLSGISRETVSTEIKRLKDDTIISIKNKIYTINDLEKLKELSTIYHEEKPLPYSF